jgi:hypothetical protein
VKNVRQVSAFGIFYAVYRQEKSLGILYRFTDHTVRRFLTDEIGSFTS